MKTKTIKKSTKSLLRSGEYIVLSLFTTQSWPNCYELKSLELDKRTNFCIRINTRKLNRESFTE